MERNGNKTSRNYTTRNTAPKNFNNLVGSPENSKKRNKNKAVPKTVNTTVSEQNKNVESGTSKTLESLTNNLEQSSNVTSNAANTTNLPVIEEANLNPKTDKQEDTTSDVEDYEEEDSIEEYDELTELANELTREEVLQALRDFKKQKTKPHRTASILNSLFRPPSASLTQTSSLAPARTLTTSLTNTNSPVQLPSSSQRTPVRSPFNTFVQSATSSHLIKINNKIHCESFRVFASSATAFINECTLKNLPADQLSTALIDAVKPEYSNIVMDTFNTLTEEGPYDILKIMRMLLIRIFKTREKHALLNTIKQGNNNVVLHNELFNMALTLLNIPSDDIGINYTYRNSLNDRLRKIAEDKTPANLFEFQSIMANYMEPDNSSVSRKNDFYKHKSSNHKVKRYDNPKEEVTGRQPRYKPKEKPDQSKKYSKFPDKKDKNNNANLVSGSNLDSRPVGQATSSDLRSPIPVIFDSGSTYNIFNIDVINATLSPTDIKLLSFNDTSIQVFGKCQITLEITPSWDKPKTVSLTVLAAKSPRNVIGAQAMKEYFSSEMIRYFTRETQLKSSKHVSNFVSPVLVPTNQSVSPILVSHTQSQDSNKTTAVVKIPNSTSLIKSSPSSIAAIDKLIITQDGFKSDSKMINHFPDLAGKILINQNLKGPSSHPFAKIELKLTKDLNNVKTNWRNYLPHVSKEEVSKRIAEMIRDNIIEEAEDDQNFNVPIIATKKKDGSIRICSNAKTLNFLTADTTNYPLPNNDELLLWILDKRPKFLSHIDLNNAYWLFKIVENSRDLTKFRFNGKTYRWVRMCFGLKEAASKFQHLIDTILVKCQDCSRALIDDIMVVDYEDNLPNATAVIELLNEFNMRINPSKSVFAAKETTLLGHLIGVDSLKPDPKKIETILAARAPNSKLELQKFLGLTNYLRKFYDKYAECAAPLQAAINKRFSWTPDLQKAFDDFKRLFAEDVSLRSFNSKLPATLYVDASQIAVASSLQQDQIPIAVFSKKLSKSQQNWSALQREVYAIVEAVKNFKKFFRLTNITIHTDNMTLASAYESLRTTARRAISNWISELAEMNLHIVWSQQNIIADLYSRLIPNDTSSTVDSVQSDDATNQAIMEIHKLHGHPGIKVTMSLLVNSKTCLHLPLGTLRKLTADIVHKCNECSKWKATKRTFHQWNSSFKQPNEVLHVDLAELPPDREGFKFVLVSRDACSGFTTLTPLKDKSANSVADALFRHFCHHGFPGVINSDNGSEFLNSVLTKLKENFKIETHLSLPYTPQSNGTAEIGVKIFKTKLLTLLDGNLDHWNRIIPWVQAITNFSPATRSNIEPSFLHFGRKVAVPPMVFESVPSSITSRLENIQAFQKHLPDFLDFVNSIRQNEVKSFNTSNKVSNDILPNGTIVHLIDHLRGSKTNPRYIGPFLVKTFLENSKSYILTFQNGKELKGSYPLQSLKVAGNIDNTRFTVKKILEEDVANQEFLCEVEENNDLWWLHISSFDNKDIIKRFRKQVSKKK